MMVVGVFDRPLALEQGDLEKVRNECIEQVAAEFHEQWKLTRPRRERRKKLDMEVDRVWAARQENIGLVDTEDKVDIANLSFQLLPPSWQDSNIKEVRELFNEISERIADGTSLDDTSLVESLAAEMHNKWIEKADTSKLSGTEIVLKLNFEKLKNLAMVNSKELPSEVPLRKIGEIFGLTTSEDTLEVEEFLFSIAGSWGVNYWGCERIINMLVDYAKNILEKNLAMVTATVNFYKENHGNPEIDFSILAEKIHEAWRSSQPFEARRKPNDDFHSREYTMDIANRDYFGLTEEYKQDNRASATEAVDLVQAKLAKEGKTIHMATQKDFENLSNDEEFIQSAAATVHERWLERNSYAKSDPLKGLSYENLLSVESGTHPNVEDLLFNVMTYKYGQEYTQVSDIDSLKRQVKVEIERDRNVITTALRVMTGLKQPVAVAA